MRGYRLFDIAPRTLVGGRAESRRGAAHPRDRRQQGAHPQLRARVPAPREGRHPRRGLLRHRQRLRAGRLDRPQRFLVALQVVGLRLPLVQPHRAAALRVGHSRSTGAATPSPAPGSTNPSTSSSRSATSSSHPSQGHTMRILTFARHPRNRRRARAHRLGRRAQDRLRRPAASPQRGGRGQGRQGAAQEGLRRQAEAARPRAVRAQAHEGGPGQAGRGDGRRRQAREAGRARPEVHGGAGLVRAAPEGAVRARARGDARHLREDDPDHPRDRRGGRLHARLRAHRRRPRLRAQVARPHERPHPQVQCPLQGRRRRHR